MGIDGQAVVPAGDGAKVFRCPLGRVRLVLAVSMLVLVLGICSNVIIVVEKARNDDAATHLALPPRMWRARRGKRRRHTRDKDQLDGAFAIESTSICDKLQRVTDPEVRPLPNSGSQVET